MASSTGEGTSPEGGRKWRKCCRNRYEIRFQGHLDSQWSEWFDGLTMRHDPDGTTVLRGPLPDEAALHGVLIKVRDLAVPLLAVNRIQASGEEGGSQAG